MAEKIAFVATTIFQPSQALKAFALGGHERDWSVYVVGDKKTPEDFSLPVGKYISVEASEKMKWSFPKTCPYNHYSRKNIGYIEAIAAGCEIIVESDDDNSPYETFFAPRTRHVSAAQVNDAGWVNVYSRFTEKHVWPRGLPLSVVKTANPDWSAYVTSEVDAPIQQGLADISPDVDALYRLLDDEAVVFDPAPDVALGKNTWSPFNSQNTSWWKPAFPLMYLPSKCSFRMTDIWRSFVAQRLAWECNWSVLYHRATVSQDRNEHDLMKDFEQEIPGYLNNDKICRLLSDLPLRSGPAFLLDNLRTAYDALIDNGWIGEDEAPLLEAWCTDMRTLGF